MKVNVSVIYVLLLFVVWVVMEVIEVEVEFVVCITEGIS